MTPATSVSIFRSEFDDFLYAPIGADKNDMPLSVLSALARLNLDPWQQAAELRDMPRATATKRLAELIAQLPGVPANRDLVVISDRLIQLLPRGTTSNSPFEKPPVLSEMPRTSLTGVLIYAVLAMAAALAIAATFESSRTDIHETPTASSPPQTNR